MGSNPTEVKFSLTRGDFQNSFNEGVHPGTPGICCIRLIAYLYTQNIPKKVTPASVQFVYVGVVSDKKSFRFDQEPPSSGRVIITATASSVESPDSDNKFNAIEQKLLPNLLNKKSNFRG